MPFQIRGHRPEWPAPYPRLIVALSRRVAPADDVFMLRALLFSILPILGFTSACTGGTAISDRAALSDPVERTIGADGFHFEVTVRLGDTAIQGNGDYVAPDRLVMTSEGGSTPTTTTIVIGRTNYVSEPDEPDVFSLWEMPCDFEVDTFIAALSVVRHAEDVEYGRGSFTFRADGDEGTSIEGEARAEDDYLVGSVLRYTLPRIDQSVEERWTFSNFGAVARIDPPPKYQILDQSRFETDPPIVLQTGQPPACSDVSSRR